MRWFVQFVFVITVRLGTEKQFAGCLELVVRDANIPLLLGS
jgi:hypothetical protein